MSLFGALTVAVGGLAAQSSAIGNISDNLANSQTTGFKGIDTIFESLVTQSNASRNEPGGVRAQPSYKNDVQGNLEESSSSTALAISGAGFFPVRAAVVGADGRSTFSSMTYFTRSGNFSLNSAGYLVNDSDYYLTGYSVDQAGVVDTSAAEPIRISEMLDNPVPTETVTYAANLPASAVSTVSEPFTSSPSTLQIYDVLGATHDLQFTWEKAASDAQYGTASLTLLSNCLILRSTTSGTYGNGISVEISTGSVSGYMVTLSGDGIADEVYDNIDGTGNALWQNIATAINADSRLVTAQAGEGTLAPTTILDTPLDLSGGTGDSVNYAASYTVADGLTFAALDDGTDGNDITVTLTGVGGPPFTSYTATITDGSTVETYAGLPTDATLWATLRDDINTNPSALVWAMTDGTGAAAPAELAATNLAGGAAPVQTTNLWYLHVTGVGGGGVSSFDGSTLDYTATIPFYFNSDASATVAAGTLEGIGAEGTEGSEGTYASTTSGLAQVTMALDFSGSGATGTQSITIDFGSYDSSSNGVTQFADTTVSVSTFEQDGIPRGSFQALSIDENGFVALNYDNGQTRTVSQIPVVQFFASNELQRVTGSAFAQTLASGTARYSAPGTNGAGTIVCNALESSNVDIATEFTKLIKAQQIYSANAKTITTANSMMDTIINTIR